MKETPSPTSCPSGPPRVNEESEPAPPAPDYRRLVRRALRREKGISGYRPKPRSTEPPHEPRGADEVLAALAARYKPGDTVGIRDITAAIGVTEHQAEAVRRWAEHPDVGAWPYLRPSPTRHRRPKGGGS